MKNNLKVTFQHCNMSFSFTRSQWEAAVKKAVKTPPTIRPNARHVITIVYHVGLSLIHI